MSPNEAAGLLGVSPTAAPDEVQRAYVARLAEAGPDVQRRDALTAARDALIAASPWHAPAQAGYAAPGYGQQPENAPSGYGQQAGYPQQPGYPQQTGYPQQQPPYPNAVTPIPWYPPAPARRPMSTGAIVGITLGSLAAGLVLLLVALFAVAAVGSRSSLPEAGSGSSAAPFDTPTPAPSDDPSADPSPGGSGDSGVEDYDVDGVHIHYLDGWTFELTPSQTCAGATITAGFSDTQDGDVVDEWSTDIDLQAGVPATLTIPESASIHNYAGIDAVECGQA